jgi:hypothetical protein
MTCGRRIEACKRSPTFGPLATTFVCMQPNDANDRDIADALWAADALEKLLCKLCRQAAGELEAIAQALRRWAR